MNKPKPAKAPRQTAFDFRDSQAFQPTTALPGSFEKVEVLRQRVENGEPLWHPSDRLAISRDLT